MATLKNLRLDRDRIKKGRWFSTEQEFGMDWRLLIANFRTPGFTEAYAQAIRDAGADGDDRSERVVTAVAPVVADFLLLGWDGLFDDDNETVEVSYSRELAIEVLCDQDMSHVVTFVLDRAKNVAEYLVGKSTDALGN